MSARADRPPPPLDACADPRAPRTVATPRARNLNSTQRCYPGGTFDPLNLAADPEKAFSLKTAEIKHSRLAMISFLGISIQGLKNGKGAVEALFSIGQ